MDESHCIEAIPPAQQWPTLTCSAEPFPDLDVHTPLELESLSQLPFSPIQPPGTSSSPPWALSLTQPAPTYGCPAHCAWALTPQAWDAPTHGHLPCSVAPNGFRAQLLRHRREGEERGGEEVNLPQYDQLIKVNWAKSGQYHEASAFFSSLLSSFLFLPVFSTPVLSQS